MTLGRRSSGLHPAGLASFAVVALFMVAACAGPGPGNAAPATVDRGAAEAVVYVALGDQQPTIDELAGSWAQVLFRRFLPRRTVHVNLTDVGATVCCFMTVQVAQAIELRATLATVWFGAGDAEVSMPSDRFAEDLGSGIGRLQAAGTRVLLITGPAQANGRAAPYAQEIADVAARTGADLVDLADLDVTGTATQQRIAEAVAKVMGEVR